jgi:hypothetical protein
VTVYDVRVGGTSEACLQGGLQGSAGGRGGIGAHLRRSGIGRQLALRGLRGGQLLTQRQRALRLRIACL